MANAKVTYTAGGASAVFVVPFPYISQDHVSVTKNGVVAPYTWLSTTQVQFTTTPALGAVILLQRTTPTTALFSAEDGSILTEAALSVLSRQAIYIAQETADIAGDLVGAVTGPTGPTGPAGADGAPGGPKGDKGDTGDTGPAGPAGADGTNGTNGTPGSAWSSGTAAPSGGNNGDYYLLTTTGVVYSKSAGVWVESGVVMSQGQTVSFETGAVVTGSTILPVDDTIPQSSEGDQYMTLAITPKSATSKLVIDVVVFGSHNLGSANNLCAALFQDTTANALAAGYVTSSGQFEVGEISFRHVMTSGTTSSTTFKVRAGTSLASVFTFNGAVSARIFGGVMASSITIREIQS